jgi:ArsR family transcriptional regulator, zinc-responsive transcriptional repressor
MISRPPLAARPEAPQPTAPRPATHPSPATSEPTRPAHQRGTDPLEEAATLFRALGNPLRLAILDQLFDGPRCVHELVAALGVSQPLVSQHLRVLRSADLLRSHRRGRETVYRLADDHVHHIVADALAHITEAADS